MPIEIMELVEFGRISEIRAITASRRQSYSCERKSDEKKGARHRAGIMMM